MTKVFAMHGQYTDDGLVTVVTHAEVVPRQFDPTPAQAEFYFGRTQYRVQQGGG